MRWRTHCQLILNTGWEGEGGLGKSRRGSGEELPACQERPLNIFELATLQHT